MTTPSPRPCGSPRRAPRRTTEADRGEHDGNHYFAYRRLGIPWFLSTMVVGSKGAPRVALTADDREALGTFAEVALVAGDVTMLEAALAQWKAAGELDPSRAKALEARAARAANEAEAHRVIADALAKNRS